jgi:ATP-dependent protease ClpP protease subunit
VGRDTLNVTSLASGNAAALAACGDKANRAVGEPNSKIAIQFEGGWGENQNISAASAKARAAL